MCVHVYSYREVSSTVRPVRLGCQIGFEGREIIVSTLAVLFDFVDMLQKDLNAFNQRWRQAKKGKKVQDG